MDRLEFQLARFSAVALLGLRQVGKTTLARRLRPGAPVHYLDLENREDLAKLADARAHLAAHADKLAILDEVQRAPGLFPTRRR